MMQRRLVILAAMLAICGTERLGAGENTWTSVGPEGGSIRSLAVDPKNAGTVYAATLSTLYRSKDGGASWARTGFTGRPGNIVIDPRNSDTVYVGTPAGVSRSMDGGTTWTDASSGLPIAPMQLIIDPRNSGTLYALTSFTRPQTMLPRDPMTFPPTIYKTTDGGNTWNAASSGLAPGNYALTLAIDPMNPNTLYASSASAPFPPNAGTGLLKSTDGGASWSAAGAGIPDCCVIAMVVDPQDSKIIYAAWAMGPGWGGIVRSTDGGTNWTDRGSDLPGGLASGLAIDPQTPSTLYATTITGLFKSTNGGTNWNPGNLEVVQTFALDPQKPGTIYAAAVPKGTPFGGIFKTTNGGATWNAANSGIREIPVGYVAIDPQHEGTLYAANGWNVLKTVDGGAHWVTGDIDVWRVAIDPQDPETVFAVVNHDLFGQAAKSSDGGATWSRLPVASGDFVMDLAIDPQNSGVVYVGTAAEGVLKSTDGGTSWNPSNNGLPADGIGVLAVSKTKPSTLYASTLTVCDDCELLGDGVFKSTDGGSSWTAVNAGLPGGGVHGRYASSIAVDPADAATLYIGLSWSESGSYGRGVFKSIDGGASWKQLSTGLAEGSYIGPLAIDPSDSAVVYVGTEHGVLRSTDGGETWSTMNFGMPGALVRSLAIDPQEPNRVYAATEAGLFVIVTDSN